MQKSITIGIVENVSLVRFSTITDLLWKKSKAESNSLFDAMMYKDVCSKLEEMKAPSSESSYSHKAMIGKEE